MARTTATDVKNIIETTLEDAIITAYIASANTLVNSVLGTESTDLLTQIEMWLTAHMIASTRERMAAKEGAGGASIEYLGKFESDLASTPYGQMVKTLDTSGKMASLGMKVANTYAVPQN